MSSLSVALSAFLSFCLPPESGGDSVRGEWESPPKNAYYCYYDYYCYCVCYCYCYCYCYCCYCYCYCYYYLRSLLYLLSLLSLLYYRCPLRIRGADRQTEKTQRQREPGMPMEISCLKDGGRESATYVASQRSSSEKKRGNRQ